MEDEIVHSHSDGIDALSADSCFHAATSDGDKGCNAFELKKWAVVVVVVVAAATTTAAAGMLYCIALLFLDPLPAWIGNGWV
jgi:hypothetical protein